MHSLLVLAATLATIVCAAPSISSTGNGFSCPIDQVVHCCTSVQPFNLTIGTGCQAAFGGVGFATCAQGESPLCCDGQAVAGVTPRCLAPTNARLPPPAPGSAIAGLPKAVFTCPSTLSASCCDKVVASGTTTGAGAPPQAGTGCVAAAGTPVAARCPDGKLALCSLSPVVAGAVAMANFPGVLPRGK